jgi:hypothetical protein
MAERPDMRDFKQVTKCTRDIAILVLQIPLNNIETCKIYGKAYWAYACVYFFYDFCSKYVLFR